MLARYSYSLSGDVKPEIKKYIDGKDASLRGAFPVGKKLEIEVKVPRILGDAGVVIRICRDGEEDRDIPLSFITTEKGRDLYSCKLCLTKGIYYWELLFVRGSETLFTDSLNNYDFDLCFSSGNRFRMLVYEDASGAPDWFCGSTMYQIFPDRFSRGKTKVPFREDAEYEPDWYGGMPEYADVPGGKIKNNRFFGGTLYGVIEKLDYLKSLGVGVIYLNPIFEAYSNHKYDTGDYEKVDPMFGGDSALKKLIKEAGKRNMKLILDGVFNHTGDDSKYFNRKGRYDTVGAYQSEGSPYRGWYHFGETRDEYECWWNIEILPRLDHDNELCRKYFTGHGGIGEKYIRMGVGGWRLDVADELSDSFLDEFRDAVKGADPETVIIGEVWENAADKIAYGKRRRYFLDGQLDSVMNYPFRNAVIDFCTEGDARRLYDTLTELYASYPPRVCHSLMNLLGTHDTERILTCLGMTEEERMRGFSNPEKAEYKLPEEQYSRAVKLLKLASTVQYTVYGVPSLYYGDEAGMEGFGDPFCRMPYPWGRENEELLEHYKALGRIRESEIVLKNGDFRGEVIGENTFMFSRTAESKRGKKEKLTVIACRAPEGAFVSLDGRYKELLSGEEYSGGVFVPADTAVILKKM